MGAGGLGHIGIQVLNGLCAAEIIVADRSDIALHWPRNATRAAPSGAMATSFRACLS
jgi:D-arabinose 1-dehydrogenase-like Zn-dependent alcohol dehydrogenase